MAAAPTTHSFAGPETAAMSCARAPLESESVDAMRLLYHINPGMAAPRPYREQFRPDRRFYARDSFHYVAKHPSPVQTKAPRGREVRGAPILLEGRRPTCQPFGWILR